MGPCEMASGRVLGSMLPQEANSFRQKHWNPTFPCLDVIANHQGQEQARTLGSALCQGYFSTWGWVSGMEVTGEVTFGGHLESEQILALLPCSSVKSRPSVQQNGSKE